MFRGILEALATSGSEGLIKDLLPELALQLRSRENKDSEDQFRNYHGSSDQEFNQRVRKYYHETVDYSRQNPSVFNDGTGKKIKILTSAQCSPEVQIGHLVPFGEISNLVLYCMDQKYDEETLSKIIGAATAVLQRLPQDSTFTLLARTEKLQQELLTRLCYGKYFAATFRDEIPLDQLTTVKRILLSWGKDKSTYVFLASMLTNDIKKEKDEPNSFKQNNIMTIVIDDAHVDNARYSKLKELLVRKKQFHNMLAASSSSTTPSAQASSTVLQELPGSDSILTSSEKGSRMHSKKSSQENADNIKRAGKVVTAATTEKRIEQFSVEGSSSSSLGAISPHSTGMAKVDAKANTLSISAESAARAAPVIPAAITTKVAPTTTATLTAKMVPAARVEPTAALAAAALSTNQPLPSISIPHLEPNDHLSHLGFYNTLEGRLNPQVQAQYMHKQDAGLSPYLTLQPPHHDTKVEFTQVFNVPLDSYYSSLFENLLLPSQQQFDQLIQFDNEDTASLSNVEEIIDNRILDWYRFYKSLEDKLYSLLQEFEIAQQLFGVATAVLQQHRILHKKLIDRAYRGYNISDTDLGLALNQTDDGKVLPSIEQLQVALAKQTALLEQTEREFQDATNRCRDIQTAIQRLYESENAFVNSLHTEGYHVVRFLFNDANNLLSALSNSTSVFSLNSFMEKLRPILQADLQLLINQKNLTQQESDLCTKLLTASYGCVIYQPVNINASVKTFKKIVLPLKDSNNYLFAQDAKWHQFIVELKTAIGAMSPSKALKEKFQSSYHALEQQLAAQKEALEYDVQVTQKLIEDSNKQAADLENALSKSEDVRRRNQLGRIRENIAKWQMQLQQFVQRQLDLDKTKHLQRYEFLQFWNNPENHKPFAQQEAINATDKDKASSLKMVNVMGERIKILSPYNDPIYEFKRKLQAVNAQIFEFNLTPDGFVDQRGQTLDAYLNAILPYNSVAIFPEISSNGRVVPEKFRVIFNPKRTRPSNLPKIKFIETYTIRVGYGGYALGELSHSVNLLPNEKKTVTVETKTTITDKVNATKEQGSERQSKFTSSFEDNLQNEFSNKANISESDSIVQSEKRTDEQKAQALREADRSNEFGKSSGTENTSGRNTNRSKATSDGVEMSNTSSSSTSVGVGGTYGIKEGPNVNANASKNWANGSSTVRGTGDASTYSVGVNSQHTKKNTTNSQYSDKQKSQESRENALTNALSSEGTQMSSRSQELAQKNVSNSIRKVAKETSDNNKLNITSSNSQTYEKSTTNREEIHLENPNNGCTINYNFFQLQNKYNTTIYLEDVKVVVCEDSGVTFNHQPLENYRVFELEDFVKMFANSNGSDYSALVAAVAGHKILKQYFNSNAPLNKEENVLTLTEDDAQSFDIKRCDALGFATDNTPSDSSFVNKEIDARKFLANIKQALAYLKRFEFSFNKRQVQVVKEHTVNAGAYFVDSQIGLQPAIEPFLEHRRLVELESMYGMVEKQKATTEKIRAESAFIMARTKSGAFFQPLPTQVEHLTLQGGYGGFWRPAKLTNTGATSGSELANQADVDTASEYSLAL